MATIREQDLEIGEHAFLTWRDAALAELNALTEDPGAPSGNHPAIPTDTGDDHAPRAGAIAAVPAEIEAIPAEERMNIAPALPRRTMAMAVRFSLFVLERKAPGPGVEVRVAPYSAVKILEGPASDPHNLTPPDVIELDPAVWMRLACGITSWGEEREAGHITAVGERDNLAFLLPLI